MAKESSFFRKILSLVVLVLVTKFRAGDFPSTDDEIAAGMSPRVLANLNIP